MKKLTEDRIAELERLAKEATPGPWEYRHPAIGPSEPLQNPVALSRIINNGKFIAAANPGTILALIEDNRRLRSALAESDRILRSIQAEEESLGSLLSRLRDVEEKNFELKRKLAEAIDVGRAGMTRLDCRGTPECVACECPAGAVGHNGKCDTCQALAKLEAMR